MTWMILPVAACVVIVLTLGWFGLHVLQRGVIFVDLALAQVAALGTTYAVYLGHEPDSGIAFSLALVFTFIGAAAFSMTRLFEDRVPQEAIIGIAYAVSAASGILMIHFADDPHGGEKLEHLLVGNIVWVQPNELMLLSAVCGAVGLFHLIFRERFLQISYRPEEAEKEGRNIPFWDLLFYLSFGFALTAIVSVSGVLLVFSYLVIPAVIARLLVDGTGPRLGVAWGLGLLVSVLGVAVSYSHPTGPVIVGFFGIALVTVLLWYAIRHAESPMKAAGQAVAMAAAVAAVLFFFKELPVPPDHDEVVAAEAAAAAAAIPAGDPLLGADTAARDTAAREVLNHPDRKEVLVTAMGKESDESVKLTMATVLVKLEDKRGLEGLVSLTTATAPFVRMEADTTLRGLAGAAAPVYDPLAAPDDKGVWKGWLTTVSSMPAGANAVALP